MIKFDPSFEYKVIYIFSIDDDLHKGLLKIGDTTLKTNKSIDELFSCSSDLNLCAKERIKQYTNTAGINVNLLYTELAVKSSVLNNGSIVLNAFRDYDVHEVLENSGYEKATINGTTGREWYKVDLDTAVKAIDAVKKGYNNLSNSVRKISKPVIFRPEQEEAIAKTVKRFSSGSKMLWNAKMRFGKTLCALEVVKRCNFNKTIIITHRPVVDFGWYEDFNKIFNNSCEYIYGSKSTGYDVEQLEKTNKKYVYFASMQDLRGSISVGGKFEKNDAVFDIVWDCVIVDEAHEGTQTVLGDSVIKKVVKDDDISTKFLALSGTPFNIIRDYDEDSIYTWDYVMEQECKSNWTLNHFGDFNPYEELPELKIYTYDLGKIIKKDMYIELEDKAFNFKEFFRVWTGDVEIDQKPLPSIDKIGKFVHEDDVKSFLNLITMDDEHSNYPYSRKEYRDNFKHSLWTVPGVKEAKALSELLKNHPVFGMGFEIVNVAGEGDDDVKQENALKMVKNSIKNAGENGYTITLSCGKLTTGVTIPEWSAVMMLSGSCSTSAANYLQTIFRVQSPCNKDGKIKTSAYVFDFAPDRTLKMVAEAVKVSTKAGKTQNGDKNILGKFLNYCPVISIDGTEMKEYSSNHLLQQLKRAYAERVVRNGFDDPNIYNDELLKLDDIQLKDFERLKSIIGTSHSSQKMNEIDINKQGFTDEEYEEKKKLETKPQKERTPEEQARLEELKEKNKIRKNAISILRGISIRMPLLIYGAEVSIDEDIKISELPYLVDDQSWEEFMPTGVSKDVFLKFIQYYDEEVFISAGHSIRNIIKAADNLTPLERTKKIANLFSCFRNPDKETVLTPWRVVNMHLSECIGGYKFYDEFNNDMIEDPIYYSYPNVTKNILENPNVKILEINSKTGLYPLYITFSIYENLLKKELLNKLDLREQKKIWNKVVRENIYIICKTPMARRITQRTLLGFSTEKINSYCPDNIINDLKNEMNKFISKIERGSTWRKEEQKMKFDVVIGNPPYQLNDGSGASNDAANPIYQYFVETAINMKVPYISLIIPSKWMIGGKAVLKPFRKQMMVDTRLSMLTDYEDSSFVFSGQHIDGGICYFLRDNNHDGKLNYRYITSDGNSITSDRYLNDSESDIVIRDVRRKTIIKKSLVGDRFKEIVSLSQPFGIRKDLFNSPDRYPNSNLQLEHFPNSVKIIGVKGIKGGAKRMIGYINDSIITKNRDWIDKYKLFFTTTYSANATNPPEIVVAPPNMICTETFLVIGPFASKEQQQNCNKYIHTNFFKILLYFGHGTMQVSQDVFRFIPNQDFSDNSDIDWDNSIQKIDNQLYLKYGFTKEELNFIKFQLFEKNNQ